MRGRCFIDFDVTLMVFGGFARFKHTDRRFSKPRISC